MDNKIIQRIDTEIQFLHRSRSVFPHLSANLVGEQQVETAPYYKQKGFHVRMEFSPPLTLEVFNEINELGHWLNQNFILRLFAVLESGGLISPKNRIRPDVHGHDEVEIVRFLRNHISHGTGQYDSNDWDKKKLYRRIVQHFNLNPQDFPEDAGQYPLPINQVLIPLAEGCKRYVKGSG